MQKDDQKSTALHLASRGGFLPIVQYLVENGADVNDAESTSENISFNSKIFLGPIKRSSGSGTGTAFEKHCPMQQPQSL